jgi:hypothetical protein
MSVLEFCQWIEMTWVATQVRESIWGFSILATIHVLSVTFSVGTLIWFDLRLLGVSLQRQMISRIYRQLSPWMMGGFMVSVCSGVILFAGFATRSYSNTAFHIKLVALLLAGTNALVYHLMTERGIADWDNASTPPSPARAAGIISLVLWTTVIVAGRTMAYTLF